jgi:pyrroloquinoline quinone biosynthesis protein D
LRAYSFDAQSPEANIERPEEPPMESRNLPDQLEPTGALNHRDLGDEFLFYDRDGDQVHVLNGVARDVFLLCDGSRTNRQIVEEIIVRYEVEAERASVDVLRTLSELLELEILRAATG